MLVQSPGLGHRRTVVVGLSVNVYQTTFVVSGRWQAMEIKEDMIICVAYAFEKLFWLTVDTQVDKGHFFIFVLTCLWNTVD